MKTVFIEIPDMQSTHCQMRVRQAVEGIDSVHVNSLKPGHLEIVSGNATGPEDARKAIQRAGYTVATMKESADSTPAKILSASEQPENCSMCTAHAAA